MCGVCLNLINKEINKKSWDSAGFEPPPSKDRFYAKGGLIHCATQRLC